MEGWHQCPCPNSFELISRLAKTERHATLWDGCLRRGNKRMLDRYEKYAPAVIFLTAGFLILGYSFEVGRATGQQEERKEIESTRKPDKRISTKQEGQEGQARENKATKQLTGDFLGIPRGEGLLIVVTLILGGATYRLVTTGKVSAERQLRAYLSIEPEGINPYFGQSFLIGHIKIRNNGRIPAKNVSIFSDIQRFDSGERVGFDLGEVKKTKMAVQPRANMKYGTYGKWDIPAPEKVRDRRIDMNGFLYVWGIVTYTDSFGTEGWTKFCHRYPCEMFGRDGAGLHSISRKYARYHEEDGNAAN
jgi:hypothetical protein